MGLLQVGLDGVGARLEVGLGARLGAGVGAKLGARLGARLAARLGARLGAGLEIGVGIGDWDSLSAGVPVSTTQRRAAASTGSSSLERCASFDLR